MPPAGDSVGIYSSVVAKALRLWHIHLVYTYIGWRTSLFFLCFRSCSTSELFSLPQRWCNTMDKCRYSSVTHVAHVANSTPNAVQLGRVSTNVQTRLTGQENEVDAFQAKEPYMTDSLRRRWANMSTENREYWFLVPRVRVDWTFIQDRKLFR